MTPLEVAGYPVFGFVVTYIGLELAWHFTACKVDGGTHFKPCVFKEVKTLIVRTR